MRIHTLGMPFAESPRHPGMGGPFSVAEASGCYGQVARSAPDDGYCSAIVSTNRWDLYISADMTPLPSTPMA